jgi:hypothetical protein
MSDELLFDKNRKYRYLFVRLAYFGISGLYWLVLISTYFLVKYKFNQAIFGIMAFIILIFIKALIPAKYFIEYLTIQEGKIIVGYVLTP